MSVIYMVKDINIIGTDTECGMCESVCVCEREMEENMKNRRGIGGCDWDLALSGTGVGGCAAKHTYYIYILNTIYIYVMK